MPEQEVLISLHDVMPETMPRVSAITDLLAGYNLFPATLLVVPGKEWSKPHLEVICSLVEAGFQLAAHGWIHRARHISGIRHRLHSLFLSGDVAEHLPLPSSEILHLMKRSKDWFAAAGLPVPDLYVPPAWALGSIRTEDLRMAPFRQVEILRGVLFPQSGKLVSLPLVGFEVKSAWRKAAVQAWNQFNLKRARNHGAPLRISIHPYDFELPLRASLKALLRSDNLRPRPYQCLNDLQDTAPPGP